MGIVKRLLVYGLCVTIVILAAVEAARSMPVFSRKYQTSCMTCHESFPTLNANGEAYRLNGYKFKDDELYRKEEPVELGDEAYKRLWPKSVWPGQMPQYAPVSFISKWIVELDFDTQTDPLTDIEDDSVTFILPHVIEVAWAGPFGEHISLYGDAIFFQEDFSTDEIDSWLTFKAWIQFEDLLGPENAFNVRLGSVGVHSMGLFNARDEQSISVQPYTLNSWFMPDLLRGLEGEVLEDLRFKDFEGNAFVLQPQIGIEINGFGKNWLYHAGVVNGNIDNPLGKKPEDDVFVLGAGSNTSEKDYYFQVAYKFGGLSFDGSEIKEEKQLSSDGQFWRDDSLMVSLFGYLGTWQVKTVVWSEVPPTIATPHTSIISDDKFWRLGLGLRQKYKDLTLSAGYIYGNNDDPYGILSDASVDTHSWFFEAYYFAYPWLILHGRYDGLQFDGLPENLLLDGEQDRQILTLGCKAHIRANISLQADGTIYTQDEGWDYGLDKTLFFLLNAAF